jgi:MFS superfamily sulfate permease-like transporter
MEFFRKHREDVIAGFTLFLMALPLSVGISLASGAPASAGLLAAIVGGLIGSWMGGGHVNINGPAAGLIVIVLGAVQELGAGDAAVGFRLALASFVIAGAFQVILGVLKMGKLALAFPSSVIHGMLTSIGLIIIIKQIPVFLGVSTSSKGLIAAIINIPQVVLQANPAVAVIGIVSLLLMILWPKLKIPGLKKVPASLMAVTFGLLAARWFDFEHQHLYQFLGASDKVGPHLLLTIPERLTEAVIFPDFSMIQNFLTWKWAFSLALIAAIESTLSAYAVDHLDPAKRATNLDRDLWSKGLCNMFLGLIGGLPIIAEIVRSSANITEGAKSWRSNFVHGFFILLFLALFPFLLHEIPLSSFSAILLVVGFRLAKPSQFAHAFHVGADNFLSFMVTIIMILATDILIGVFAGLCVELVMGLMHKASLKSFFKLEAKEIGQGQKEVTLKVTSGVVFTQFPTLRRKLLDLASNHALVKLDLSTAPFIDHTCIEQLKSLTEQIKAKKSDLVLLFSDSHQALGSDECSSQKLA